MVGTFKFGMEIPQVLKMKSVHVTEYQLTIKRKGRWSQVQFCHRGGQKQHHYKGAINSYLISMFVFYLIICFLFYRPLFFIISSNQTPHENFTHSVKQDNLNAMC